MKHSILAGAALMLLSFFSANAAKQPERLSIVPCPQSYTIEKGSFKLAGANVNCDAAFDLETIRIVSQFANQISMVSGKTSSVATPVGIKAAADKGAVKGLVFVKDAGMEAEAYSLNVTSKYAVVKASTFNGVLYAIQTLKQLLPVDVYANTMNEGESWRIPCCTVTDKPRFEYRGFMLDCARHFWSVEETKKVLDIMSIYKLNRLHWHLSDDQGWRVEIKKYPKLTEIGAYRNGTCIKKDFNTNDGIRYGGYYTQDQLREVVKYAQSLGITVIPEIDLPGHMVAALTSYPELGCSGGPYEVRTKWGIADEALCPGKEGMFTFLEDVIAEMSEIFPGEYFHIGGDECRKGEWEKCPHCQARIAELGLKSDGKYTKEQYLQSYVTARVQKIVAKYGKRIIGWDEILEGELAPGATVMSWRGTKGGIAAANAGFDVIMSPSTYLYFDYYQGKDLDKEPLAIGKRVLPLKTSYDFNPFDGIDASCHSYIKGVQANLWTEYIATPEHLEYMFLPRMLALCEIQWCKPEVKDYERFCKDLEDHEFAILKLLGYNYREGLHD